MVEGHSVHRLVRTLGVRLVGRKLAATSPNGRFAEGAKAIHEKKFLRLDAVGKNLFAFFEGPSAGQETVVHVHFGMSGRWAVFDSDAAPEPTPTTRLRLDDGEVVAHLSAMTVQHGPLALFEQIKSKLGEDPLRTDAEPEALWERVKKSKKGIGLLLMDQAFFPGIGNIYRAEIGFVSGVHPGIRGCDLTREQFDTVWETSVALLERGVKTGSILTTDKDEVKRLGQPNLRRYIYNQSSCIRCGGRVMSWALAGRTCYACPSCQPLPAAGGEGESMDEEAKATAEPAAKAHTPFLSHCAPDPLAERISAPSKLRVAELKAALKALGQSTKGLKKDLVGRLEAARRGAGEGEGEAPSPGAGSIIGLVAKAKKRKIGQGVREGKAEIASAAAAAAEKRRAGEKGNVEHVAEFDQTAAGRAEVTVHAEFNSGASIGNKRRKGD